jgi:uncharacterized membrane protein
MFTTMMPYLLKKYENLLAFTCLYNNNIICIMAHLEVKPRSGSNWLIWLIIIIIVAVVAYFLWSGYADSKSTLTTKTDSTKTTTDSAATRPAK